MTETTELAIHEPTGLPMVPEEVISDYLKNLGVKIPDHHMQQFIHLAKAHNLNPFDREIYAIPRGGKLTIVIGYEVYLKRAERSRMLAGWEAWVEGTGADMVAKIKIHRKDWAHPFTHEVYFSEYKMNTPLWQQKPRTMLRKVVTAQGFRMAFPTELGGMPYTDVEMDPAGEPIQIENEAPPAIAEMIGTGAEPEPDVPLPEDIIDVEDEVTDQHIADAEERERQKEIDEKHLKREKGKINRLRSSVAISDWWVANKESVKSEANEATSRAIYDYAMEQIKKWHEFEAKKHEESES